MNIIKGLGKTVPISKFTIIIMLGGTALIGFLFGIIYKETAKYNQEQNSYGNQTVCTQEAKLCPDGKTSVSRQGPNCEFSPCP